MWKTLFNTNLPSGRRRLFVFLLLVFSIVGFGTRYLLITLGWVGSNPTETLPQKPPEASVPKADSKEEEIPAISEADRQEAREVATNFVKAYLQYGPEKEKVFLKKVGPWVTATLQEELTPTGPQSVKSVKASRVEDYYREQNGQVIWNVWATLDKGKGKDGYEVVHEVVLIREAGSWRVQEVTPVEYPDFHGE
ncbi:Uncharacterised protein [Mycobacterium tuberculosis]|nr:Uncharacterised protein [Mycobacterium tuberculosis]